MERVVPKRISKPRKGLDPLHSNFSQFALLLVVFCAVNLVAVTRLRSGLFTLGGWENVGLGGEGPAYTDS